MGSHEKGIEDRARRALEKLVTEHLDSPGVTNIDIGYAPDSRDRTPAQLVLRVHVDDSWMKTAPEDRTFFPDDVDGFPVIVMRGNYRLEQ
jgi:hypothetical protein